MTNWLPDISMHPGPRYRAIADAIASAVREGHLAPGDRLPTHRDLAIGLGVTTGTITRAYKVVTDWGLVSGEVGRGTFIRRLASEQVRFDAPDGSGSRTAIDLAHNVPVSVGNLEREMFRTVLEAVAQEPTISVLSRSSALTGATRAHEAGAGWLRSLGLNATARRVLIGSGVQHAMLASVAAITRPGDSIACGAMSYPGIRALANTLRLNLVPVAMDEGGLVPDAFERACAEYSIRALYCVPTGHTPTAIIMSSKRRRRIAEIACARNTLILEDDEDTPLITNAPEPIAAIAPEQTIYLGGTEMAIAPGMRIAFILAPSALVQPIAEAIRTTIWIVPPVMAEAMAIILERGWADRIVAARRKELDERHQLAHETFAGLDAPFRRGLHHAWLTLPEPWRADQFQEAARAQNILVQTPEPFVVARASAPRAIRLCLGAEPDQNRLRRGLEVVAGLLHGKTIDSAGTHM